MNERDRKTRAVDDTLIRKVLAFRFGSVSHDNAIAEILAGCVPLRVGMRIVYRKTLPDGTEVRLPGPTGVRTFLRGERSDNWRQLCAVLGVTYDQVKPGAGEPVLTRPDDTVRLVELPHIVTAGHLLDVLAAQRYTHSTAALLKQHLADHGDPSALLDLAASVVIDGFAANAEAVGLGATLLSNNVDAWRPKPAVVRKVAELTVRAMRTGMLSHVATVEPLAFALAPKGKPAVQRTYLRIAMEEEAWRLADAARVASYYDKRGAEVSAIQRHFRDGWRKGLLLATDAPRVMHLLSLPDPALHYPPTRAVLTDLLSKTAVVLSENGEDGLLKRLLQGR